MKSPKVWKGCLGCLATGVLGLALLYCLIAEPWLLFGPRTRFMVYWDHHITLPSQVRILSRESGGNFMDGHITTVLTVKPEAVPTILAQLQPSPRHGNKVISEGTATNGHHYGKQEGSDSLTIDTQLDATGEVRMTITTRHD
jgi:hypothetical protein